MGIDNIIYAYNESINLIPIMENNYNLTFSDNKNKSEYFMNMTNEFIYKLGSVYEKYKDYKFPNINPRNSEKIRDNSFQPGFIGVKYIYNLNNCLNKFKKFFKNFNKIL